MKSLLTILALCISILCLGRSATGVVFVDTNNNGTRENGEPGISGVAVSDQVNVVSTDAQGGYSIVDVNGFGLIFISVPSGYKASKSFYSKLEGTGNAVVDFPLTKAKPQAQFSFVHASDTHISETSVSRTRTFIHLVDSVKADFVVVTGDLVRDALRVPESEATRLYEMYKTEISKSSAPVWSAPGNHEIFGIERHLSLVSKQNPLYGRKMFRHYLGPDYYSFNYGGLHFVALNSLEFEDLWYYGSIDSVQREWLKRDLAAISPTTPVITFQHVPFISGELSTGDFIESGPARTLEREKGVLKFRHVVSNFNDVFKILRTRPFPLALGGHHHTRQLFFIETEGQQTRFEQAAAVVGPVENGALKMPSGITLYKVKDGVVDKGTFLRIK